MHTLLRLRLWSTQFLAALAIVSAHEATLAKDVPCQKMDSTIDLRECYGSRLKEKDAELNAEFGRLMKSLVRGDNANDKTDYAKVRRGLVEAQRSWVKLRDSDCGALLEYYSEGTIGPVKYLLCLLDHTEIRLKQLKNWDAI